MGETPSWFDHLWFGCGCALIVTVVFDIINLPITLLPFLFLVAVVGMIALFLIVFLVTLPRRLYEAWRHPDKGR